jgi:hypothetical protein
MTIYAVDLQLPFETDMLDLAKRVIGPNPPMDKATQYRVPNELLDVRVLRFLEDLGIAVRHAEAFHTPPKTTLHLHVDGANLDDCAKLNWCYGGGSTKMMWWKLKPGKEAIPQKTAIGTNYLTMHANDCVPVHSWHIKTPTLVNVGRPHSVPNFSDESRWVISLVLWSPDGTKAVQMEEAAQRLKHLC